MLNQDSFDRRHEHLTNSIEETHNKMMRWGRVFAIFSSCVSIGILVFVGYVAVCLLSHFGVNITPWK